MINAVYVHVPFCASKCAYCSFNSCSGMEGLFQAYAEALRTDIRESAAAPVENKITSVYFGGGTPYYWGAKHLLDTLELIRQAWPLDPAAEISLEANPGSLTTNGLAALREAGFNRISIGAQSFSNRCLALVGRRHLATDIARGVRAARDAGFSNLSLDLMYGLPKQSLRQWTRDLEQAVDLEPSHISVYGLTLDAPTYLWRQVSEGKVTVADDDLQADMYELGAGLLENCGYRMYELSSFARRGYECRHNLNYWRLGGYLGVGAGAHSYVGGRRYWKTTSPKSYIKSLFTGAAIEGGEELSGKQLAGDEAMLALRLREGLDVHRFAVRHGDEFLASKAGQIEELAGLGLVAPGRRLVLTPKGRLLANEVMQVFV